MKIVILASDTPHRRYFIKQLVASGLEISLIIFETNSIKPSFPIGPFYAKEENDFEQDNFFTKFNNNLDSLNVSYVENINNNESHSLILRESAELCVTFGTRKISKKTLALFKNGGINVHRGIAEKYKGLDSNLWAFYHKDYYNFGVTIHLLDDGLDTGDIIHQDFLQYPSSTKIYQMRYYETVLASSLTEKSIKSYLNNSLRTRVQKNTGRYYSFMPLVIKRQLPLNVNNE